MNRLTLITAYKKGDMHRFEAYKSAPHAPNIHALQKPIYKSMCVTRGRGTTQHAVYDIIM